MNDYPLRPGDKVKACGPLAHDCTIWKVEAIACLIECRREYALLRAVGGDRSQAMILGWDFAEGYQIVF